MNAEAFWNDIRPDRPEQMDSGCAFEEDMRQSLEGLNWIIIVMVKCELDTGFWETFGNEECDENTSWSSMTGRLDFEEIPDDIDIDEPIEVENFRDSEG